MPPRYNALEHLPQEVRFAGVAFEIEIQLPVMVHYNGDWTKTTDNSGAGSGGERTCAHATVMPAVNITKQVDAVPERTELKDVARGIFGITETVLGTASMGNGIFLSNSRGGNGRDDTGIH
jgi:hypothetical protein